MRAVRGELREVPALDWGAVRDHWDRRDINWPLRNAIGRVGGVDLRSLDSLFVGSRPHEADEVVVWTHKRNLRATAAEPGLSVLLALYLFNECLRVWEESDFYGLIGQVVRCLGRAVEDLRGERTWSSRPDEDELLGWITQLALSVTEAMAVESGLNCSCPVEMGARAANAVEMTTQTLKARPAVPPGLEPAYELLDEHARTEQEYFGFIHQIAVAVKAYCDRDGRAPTLLRSMIKKLKNFETSHSREDLDRNVYATELRAHQGCLEALLEGYEKPRLEVNNATFVYCYPFALIPKSGDVVAKAIGSKRANVSPTSLTDAWDGDDPLDRQYSGATVALPKLTVTPTYEPAKFIARAELRLSRLGNHFLRVEYTLGNKDDGDLHSINQALRRASRSMGEAESPTGPTRGPALPNTPFTKSTSW